MNARCVISAGCDMQLMFQSSARLTVCKKKTAIA